MEVTRIKEKLLEIENKWKGKNIDRYHKDYSLRLIDKMKYRELRRKLKKINPTEKNEVELAKEVFEIK